ncbi:ABC transporter permease [Magnetospirillum aberrantis]|uniref:ABC transporter permease n=1 Tax=Magnetospirillum aberrantis SpK TaxID=908842 RepID=A0A7C9QTZ1_9PROT|nr:ABC transporter permease [Magnetospirillum aberrantis]NFV80081.1 ABC transporter permease [Magnetospirillum aberrantis SpK]
MRMNFTVFALNELVLPLRWGLGRLRHLARRVAKRGAGREGGYGHPCPGGLDFTFLFVLMTVLISLSGFLFVVKVGLEERVPSAMLGHIPRLGIPLALSGDGVTFVPKLDEPDATKMEVGGGVDIGSFGAKIKMIMYERLGAREDWKRKNIDLFAPNIFGADAANLRAWSVFMDSELWENVALVGLSDQDRVELFDQRKPFVIMVNKGRYTFRKFDLDSAATALRKVLPDDMVDAWLTENEGARRLDELKTAWLTIGLNYNRNGTPSQRRQIVPVRVFPVIFPGIDAPDIVFPLELQALTKVPSELTQVAPEVIACRGGGNWYLDCKGEDRFPPSWRRVTHVGVNTDYWDRKVPCRAPGFQGASVLVARCIVSSLDDPVELGYGGRSERLAASEDDRSVRLLFPLPKWRIDQALANIDDVEVRSRIARNVTYISEDLPVADWKGKDKYDFQSVIAYVPWNDRAMLPNVLKELRDDRRIYVNNHYYDLAGRLSHIMAMIDEVSYRVTLYMGASLIIFITSSLSFVVHNRRQRYALLLSQGASRWLIRKMLAVQMFVISTAAAVLSWVLVSVSFIFIKSSMERKVLDWALGIPGLELTTLLPYTDPYVMGVVMFVMPGSVCVFSILVSWGLFRLNGFRKGQSLARHLFGG